MVVIYQDYFASFFYLIYFPKNKNCKVYLTFKIMLSKLYLL
jgi:hypothetical protein